MKQVFLSLLFTLAPGLAATAADSPAATGEKSPAGPAAAQADADAKEASPLAEIAWMVGTWIDEGEDASIRTRCAWTRNHKFLTRSFAVTQDGEVVLEGTQVIGWDAHNKRIRSWTFDSEGGFGEGYWMRDGNRWLAKNAFVLATGEKASSVNVITYVDDDTFKWQSISREVGGTLQPNIPEVTIVRQKSAEGSDNTPQKAEVPQ